MKKLEFLAKLSHIFDTLDAINEKGRVLGGKMEDTTERLRKVNDQLETGLLQKKWRRPLTYGSGLQEMPPGASLLFCHDRKIISAREWDELYEKRTQELEDLPGGRQGANPNMSDVEVDWNLP